MWLTVSLIDVSVIDPVVMNLSLNSTSIQKYYPGKGNKNKISSRDQQKSIITGFMLIIHFVPVLSCSY